MLTAPRKLPLQSLPILRVCVKRFMSFSTDRENKQTNNYINSSLYSIRYINIYTYIHTYLLSVKPLYRLLRTWEKTLKSIYRFLGSKGLTGLFYNFNYLAFYVL